MYQILVSSHSGLRWIVLAFLLISLIIAIPKWLSNQEWTEGNRKITLIALISTHIQLLLGLILYFITPRFTFSAEAMKQMATRFFMVEHSLLMIIAIIVITIGYAGSKKKLLSKDKAKYISIAYLAGLILILAGIPWPFYGLSTGWF